VTGSTDFDTDVLGLSLPAGVEAALATAGACRSDDPARAMAALMQARQLAPDHPAVLIAFYRHHFYGHRLNAARDIARRALVVGAQALGLPAVWRDVPRQPLAGARFDPRTRFYLFVLKGYAYLSLRLEQRSEAREALDLLRALDPDDCVGAAVLESVRQRADAGEDDGDDDDPQPYVQATGAAAWARLAPPDPAAAEPGSNDILAIDWLGAPITAATCAACPHAALRTAQACEPGRSCLQDAYARRIDRFLRSHPALANHHLAHPYFEVRAIAARYADVFRLAALFDDPDETVRLQLALRVPQRLLARFSHDPHREVRIRVAQRIDEASLSAMVHDEDYQVRVLVARRLPAALLPLLMHDADLQVRLEVARRLAMPALLRMKDDTAPEVRRIVAERMPAPLLDALADDADWTVRWEAAGRARGAVLQRLLADAEPDVRDRAAQRQTELEGQHG